MLFYWCNKSFIIIIILLFVCAYKAWVISPEKMVFKNINIKVK
jgi:hypothetical protein